MDVNKNQQIKNLRNGKHNASMSEAARKSAKDIKVEKREKERERKIFGKCHREGLRKYEVIEVKKWSFETMKTPFERYFVAKMRDIKWSQIDI